MPDHHFWLSNAQSARLQPLLPNKVRGVPRVDDRKVISGIIHVIRYGLMWRDAPACYGPHKTPLQPLRALEQGRGVRPYLPETLASESTKTETVMIDSTHIKAHRTAASLLKKGLFRVRSGAPEAVV